MKTPKTNQLFALLGILLAGLWICAPANAFQHPGIPLTISDLNAVQANLNTEPWASGYAALQADWHSQLSYTMEGPFTYVDRNYYSQYTNENQWKNDMQAIFNLSVMWYMTGNSAYAQKAHDILLAWATTMTAFNGIENSFDIGDYAYCYAGGADILRGTWPGWTASDTTTVQAYFQNVFWPALAIPGLVPSGSQGMEALTAAIAISVFCDNQTEFNETIADLLSDANSGFRDTLPNGEMGDTGRDQGHSQLYLHDLVFIAEVCWKQGVDIYSVLNDRIAATAEYYSRTNLPGPTPAFISFGAPFWGSFWYIGGNPPWHPGPDRMTLNMIHGAYALRLGVSVPWSDLLDNDQAEDGISFVFRKSSDSSTATPPAMPVFPSVTSLTTGLTDADLNGCTPAGSSAYASGTWTLTSGYNGGDPWSSTSPTVHFTCMPVSGAFAMVAEVTSVNGPNGHAKGGIMLRDVVNGTANDQVYVALTPADTYERVMLNTSDLPYGSNAASLAFDVQQLPYWVKIEREGNIIQTFVSADGGAWSPAGTAGYSSLPSTMYVGLFGVSELTGSTSTATFANVSITGGDGGGGVQAPAPPSVIITSPGNGQVAARWAESFGATSYNVYRAATSGGPYTAVGSVPAGTTTYTDASAVNGSTYYYVVTAVNSAGESIYSMEDSATPEPAWIDVAGGGSASASANSSAAWYAFDQNSGTIFSTNGGGATGWLQYDLGAGVTQAVASYGVTSGNGASAQNPNSWQFQGSNDGATWTTLDTESGQSFAYPYQTNYYTISNSGAYRYYRLNVTANTGDPSTFELAELALLVPGVAAPPPSVTAAVPSSGQVTLSWSPVPNAEAYLVGRSAVSGGPYTTIAANVSGTTYVDTTAPANAASYYVIATINSYGPSAFSPQAAVGLPPSGLVATGGNAQVALSWTAPAGGAASYNVEHSTTSGGPYTTVATGVTATNYTDASVSNNNPYFYVVSAVTNGFQGGNSAEAVGFPAAISDTWAVSPASANWSGSSDWTGGAAPGNGASLTFGASSQIVLNNDISSLTVGNIIFSAAAGAYNLSGNAITLQGQIAEFETNLETLSMNITLGSAIGIYFYGGAGALALTGTVGDGGHKYSITEYGSGTLALSSSNSYGGGTTINGGTLAVGNNAALGTGKLTLAGATLNNTATLALANNIAVSGSAGIILGSANNITLSGTLSGSGALTLGGGSLLDSIYLNLAANTMTSGTITLPAGTNVVRFAAAGAGNPNVAWVFNNANGNSESLDFGSGTISFGSMTGNGLIGGNGGSSYTISAGALGRNDVFSGVITNVVGNTSPTVALTKVGTGTMTLNGANTYSGRTTINAGTLDVNGSLGTSSSVRVNNGGTLGGTGTVGGSTTVYSGGTISPGVSGSGTLTFSGTVTYRSGGILSLQLGAAPVSPVFSASGGLSVSGTVTINVNPLAGFGAGTYTILHSSNNIDASNFTVGRLPSGYSSVLSASGGTLSITIGPPPPPATLSATGGNAQIVLSWAASQGATAYNVMRTTTSGTNYVTVATVGTTGYTDTALTNGTTYYYVLTATNAAGVGSMSSQVSATPVAPPAAPTGLVATGSNGVVALSWTASPGATSYNVLRSVTSGSGYATVPSGTGVSGMTFSDSSVTNGTTYYYVVSASNSGGTGANSAEAGATPLAPPAAPTGLVATGSNAVVALHWTASIGATSYTVLRSVTSGSGYATVQSGVSGTTYGDSGVINGTTYYYVVTASNSDGTSANSAQAGATPVAPPSAPTGLVATGSNAVVTLSWTASSWASSYNVKRSLTSGTGYTTVASVTGSTGYADTGLTNGVTYYYVVSAVNISGESANSAEAGATPIAPPAAPTGLTATGSNAVVSLSWTASAGAASYNVLRSVTSGTGYTTLPSGTGLTGTTYSDTTVTNGTTYYYVVTASNPGGTSAISNEALAIPGAVSDTWSASPASGNWNLAGNWVGGVTPGDGAALTFGTSSITSLNNNIGNFTVGSLLYTSTASAFTLSGSAVTLEGQIANLSANTQTINFNMTLGNTVTVNAGGGNVTLGGVIGDGGGGFGIIKTGAAALTLSGANTFSGGVALDAGTVTLGASTSGTVTSGPLGTGTLTMNGGTLQMNAMTLANNVVLPSGGSAIIDNQSNNGTLNGNFSGAGTLTMQNSSGTNLSDFINGSWVGFTGTLNYNASAGSRKNFNIFVPASFDFSNAAMVFSNSGNNSGSSFRPSGTTQLGSLAGANGYIQLSGTLEIGNLNTSTTYGGVIQDSGTGSVMKVGAGTLTLTGANTYTGPTTINGGTLDVNGSLAAGSAVAVNSGGTLGGSGTVGGAVAVAGGGALAPGSAGAGALSLTGSLTLNNGSSLNIELGAVLGSAQLASSGRLSVSGTTTINITALSGFGPGIYPLISATSSVNVNSFVLGSTPAGSTCSLSASGGSLSLIVDPPAVPTGLTATGSNAVVSLSWTASTGAASYNVLRSVTSGSGYATVPSGTGVSGTTYSDTTVTNGTTYYYVVSASNPGGTSANSAQASATPSAAIGGGETLPPGIEISGSGATTNLALTVLSSVPGHTYQLQFTANLVSGSWTNVGSPQEGTGSDLILDVTINPATAPTGFYRILIQRM